MNVKQKDVPAQLAVIGLGYVGLPLATAFGRLLPTVGFDINAKRIQELRNGIDSNGETPSKELKAPHTRYTNDPKLLKECDFVIVAVPTPVDKAKRPDLTPMIKASKTAGQHLAKGAIVVYESTVYPGCTEEICVPILEQESGLKGGKDFKVGYSPERINPGDQEHTLGKIIKIVSGQDAETTEKIAAVYGLVVKAGVYRAPDIRTAEASKVIENIQRDLNIALMNELAMLFHKMGLDTKEVLKASRTKWNFLPFEPGLVGGHCIPVDPYYLTHKAQELGYYPEVILAGRRVNDAMGSYVARETIKLMIQSGKVIRDARVLVLGVAFKENVRDARSTRVVELIKELQAYGIAVTVYDPLIHADELKELGLEESHKDPFKTKGYYDAIVLAVAHQAFKDQPIEAYIQMLKNKPGVLVDVKGALREKVTRAKVLYWSL